MTIHSRLLATLLSVPIWSCSGSPPLSTTPASEGVSSGRPSVYTVNYPLQYFAERIGSGDVHVDFPAPADEDPAYWSPDAETVAAYQRAELILLNGAGYAAWVGRASLPASPVVDTSASFRERYITVDAAVTHGHGPAGEHSDGETAFTTWLDPALALEQARAVLTALSRLRPQLENSFAERFAALERDLQALDAELGTACQSIGQRPLLFSHPVYQYLERRCNLNGVSLHWEPGIMPGDREWRRLQETLREHPARTLVWEAAPLEAIRERLEELGVTSVVFSPCATRPEGSDLLGILREGIDALRQAANAATSG